MNEQMQQRAVDNARQSKADDINLMMRALGRQDAAERLGLQTAYQKATLDNARYNAETSRQRADAYDRRLEIQDAANDDPLGILKPGGGGTPAFDLPPPTDGGEPALPAGGFSPAEGIEPGADLFTPSVDGQGIVDPLVTEPPPVMDSPPDLAEGAEGVEGPSGPAGMAAGAKAPITWTAPVDQAMASGDPYPVPGVEGPAGPSGAAAGGFSGVEAAAGEGLPTPPLEVPAFDSADISAEARKDLYQLHRDNASLMQEARQANSRAATINAAIPRVRSQKSKEDYGALAAEARKTAQEKAAQAQEKAFKIAENTRSAAIIQKRQEAIGAISHLGDVLPQDLQKQLINEAKDPRTGAVADRKIAALAAYDKVRQATGLTHKSRSLETAQQVARQGMLLQTDDAKDERKAANTYESYKSLLQANRALEATSPDKADEDTEKEWRKEMNKALPLATQWKARQREFDAAVKEDTLPDDEDKKGPPGTGVTGVMPPKTTAAAGEGAPAKPAFTVPDTYDPMKSPPLEDKPEVWSALKNKFATENPEIFSKIQKVVSENPTFLDSAILEAVWRGPARGTEAATGTGTARNIFRPVARLNRTGSDVVQERELIQALVKDVRARQAVSRASASPPPTIGQWKITPLASGTD